MRKLILVGLVLCLATAIGSSIWLSKPIFDEEFTGPPAGAFAVAPIARAITLAQTRDGQVLVVTSADEAGVSGVNLNQYFAESFADAVAAYRKLGAEQLRRVYEYAHRMDRVPWESLGSPLPPMETAIAAGTNFLAHAQEVGHEGEPFLFPKLSAPTDWNADVQDGARLDYEVELCVVPMKDYVGDAVELGYILCNDFTDRWLLATSIDLDGPMGLTGFPLAKGGATRLPVGPFLVVPADANFYRQIDLHLYVNDTLRQQASASLMIWSPNDILARAITYCDNVFDLRGQSIALGSCEKIAAGTLVLTGTPAGVMFSPATLWAPWAYLSGGDRVAAYGTHLGYLYNHIIAN